MRHFCHVVLLGVAAVSVRATRLTTLVDSEDAGGVNPAKLAMVGLPAFCSALVLDPNSIPGLPVSARPLDVESSYPLPEAVDAAHQGWTGTPVRRPRPGRLLARTLRRQHLDIFGIEWAVADVDFLNEVGRGRFSTIWASHVDVSEYDDVIAIKALPMSKSTKRLIKRESGIMSRLSDVDGDHFIQYYHTWYKNGWAYIGMELAIGDMQHFVMTQTFDDVGVGHRAELALQLVEALSTMSKEQVAHRDIKPANLLLVEADEGLRLKIADFGHACSLRRAPWKRLLRIDALDKEEPVGSLPYVAPEVLQRQLSSRSDMFSAGVILYQLLFEGVFPMYYYTVQPRENEPSTIDAWEWFNIEEDLVFKSATAAAKAEGDRWLVNVLALMAKMLNKNPDERIDAVDAAEKLQDIMGDETLNATRTHEILRGARVEVAAKCHPITAGTHALPKSGEPLSG